MKSFNLVVVPLWHKVLKCEAGIPEPLSDTKILLVPPSTISNLTKEQQNDITETSLDNETDFDYIIENNSNTDLNEIAKKIIEERRNI